MYPGNKLCRPDASAEFEESATGLVTERVEQGAGQRLISEPETNRSGGRLLGGRLENLLKLPYDHAIA